MRTTYPRKHGIAALHAADAALRTRPWHHSPYGAPCFLTDEWNVIQRFPKES